MEIDCRLFVSWRSEVFGCVDTEQGKATGQHRPGGFGEREPGTVGGQGFLVPERKHRGKKGKGRIGYGDQVTGEQVGGAVGCRAGEDPGVVGEEGRDLLSEGGGDLLHVALRDLRVSYGARLGGEAEVGGVAADGPGAGVGVTDPEEGIRLPLHEVVAGETGPVVSRGVQKGPTGGVTAEGEEGRDFRGGDGDGAYGDRDRAYFDVDFDADVEWGGFLRRAVGVDTADTFDAAEAFASFDAENGHPGGLGRPGLTAGADEGTLRAQKPGDDVHDDESAGLVGGVESYGVSGWGVYVVTGDTAVVADGGAVDEPVPRSASQDLRDERGGRRTPQTDVEKAGPGDLDAADALRADEMRQQQLGDTTGALSGGPGELKGDVGGVVPPSTGPRHGHRDLLRHDHTKLPVLDSTAHRAQHGAGELDGGHGTSVGEEGGG
jgi:hypothetical protein